MDAYVGGVAAVVLMALVTVVAVILANQRLEEIELRDAS